MKLFLFFGLMVAVVACGGDDRNTDPGAAGVGATMSNGGNDAGAGAAGGDTSTSTGSGGMRSDPLTDLAAATMKQVATDAAARVVVDHDGCGLATVVATALDTDGTLPDNPMVPVAWSIAFECDNDERVVFRYQESIEPTKVVEVPAGVLTFTLDEAPDSPAIYQAYVDAGCMPSGQSDPILNVFPGMNGVDVILNGAPYWRAILDASGAVVMEVSACSN